MGDPEANEIVYIRKRRNDEEEAPHGGVWKLAFADYMTAMMAFFLVMWLINSTTKETKATIVQYFNPVQLIDASPAHKGLRDPKDAGQGDSVQQTNAPEKSSESSNSKVKEGPLHEAALFYDPLTMLEELARSDAPPGAAGQNREAPVFGDPFDRTEHSLGSSNDRDKENTVEAGAPASDRGERGATKSNQALETASPPTNSALVQQQRAPSPATSEGKTPEPTSAASMRAALEKILKSEASELRNVPNIEVTETEEGLLISLTDDANFAMFSVGSVEPKPQLVRIVKQIGRILAKQPGEIELRGHTDARSYKSATYDNWRLSSDRANMAYYMLIRGGLAEKRIGKISGYADRRLKTPKDPLADVNRRIEILIRRGEH